MGTSPIWGSSLFIAGPSSNLGEKTEKDFFYLNICVTPIGPLHDPVKWY